MTLATRIAVLKDGELQQVGSPAEIYNAPANLFVADFMGSPAMNLLEGAVSRDGGAPRIVLQRKDHPPIVVPAPDSADAGRLADGAKVIFGIRPEAVNDPESVDRNAKSVAAFDANVEIVEPAGSDTFVVIHVAGKELTARMRADATVSVGQSHTFAFNLDKAVLFDPDDHAADLIEQAADDARPGDEPTSSSSGREWAARPALPGWRPRERKS